MKQLKVKTRAATLLLLSALVVSVPAADYTWPKRDKDPYPWPQGKDAAKVLQDRFARASKKALGNEKDTEGIKKVILAHMENPKSSVNEIRWLSPTLVMARSSWYASPKAAAS